MTKLGRTRGVEECNKRSQTTDWMTRLLEINSRGVSVCVEWEWRESVERSLLLVMGKRVE